MLKFHHFLLPFATVAAAFSAPFVSLDFTDIADGVASSRQGNLEAHIDDGVKVLPNGPTGTPYLHLDGSADSTVRFNAKQVSQKLPGDEIAASFWFRPDVIEKGPIAFGFSMKTDYYASEAPLEFRLATKPNDFGTFALSTRMEGNECTFTGQWHHAAFRYSVSNDAFTVWVDGFPQRSGKSGADEPSPVDNLFGRPFARGFKGDIADIRVWNTAAPPAEILEMPVSAQAKKETADAFSAAAATAKAPQSFKKWCADMAARATAFGDKAGVRDWMRIQEARWRLPELTRVASGTTSPTLAQTPFLPIAIYPYHWLKRLPFRMPEDAAPCNVVAIRATLGEFEAASFMVLPYRSGEIFIEPTELSGPGGAKLPSSTIDVRTVKVWHSHAAGWDYYWGGGKEFPVLTGEILLHDDAMLKVDRDKHRNYLRISDPDGDRYVDISISGTPENMETFHIGAEPVRDAKTFVPMPVRDGDFSQFWITAHVPADAKPGDYSGSLSFTFDGEPAGVMPLTLHVYPFKLPRASPRYNIDARYWGSWYHHINLATKLETGGHYGGGNSLSNACRRLLAEYRNMAEHNFFNPFTVGYADPDNYDLDDIQIGLMREAGLDTDVIKGGMSSMDGEWCFGMNNNKKSYGDDISVEAHPKLFAQRMSSYSNLVKRVFGEMDKRLGHHNNFCYGIDEAGPNTVRREMPFFATLQHFGGKAYISMAVAEWCGFMADFDNIPAHIGRNAARNWHQAGSLCGSYAAPFTGPENPETWRRTMGMRLYMANYDAVSNYAWYEAFNVWDNFVNTGRYGNFCIVYPTSDGVVDTVGWEAQREGLDDVRYMTLLRRLAREAMRSKKRDVRRLGRLSYAWAELIDQECVDLDNMRIEASNRILALRDALKDVNTEALYE